MDTTYPTSPDRPTEVVSPQVKSTAPDKDCPKCGRRMQLLSVSPTSYSYVCYAHTLQNSDSNEPYYLNIHHAFLDKDGMIKVKGGKGEKDANPRA